MKNIKSIFFVTCLIFFLNLIFCTFSFATLYIVKDQEGNNICITNKENEISKYKLLGYEIYILGGSEQEISESTEKEITPFFTEKATSPTCTSPLGSKIRWTV